MKMENAKKLILIAIIFFSCNTSKKIEVAVAKAMDKYEHQQNVIGFDEGFWYSNDLISKYPGMKTLTTSFVIDTCNLETLANSIVRYGTSAIVDSTAVIRVMYKDNEIKK